VVSGIVRQNLFTLNPCDDALALKSLAEKRQVDFHQIVRFSVYGMFKGVVFGQAGIKDGFKIAGKKDLIIPHAAGSSIDLKIFPDLLIQLIRGEVFLQKGKEVFLALPDLLAGELVSTVMKYFIWIKSLEILKISFQGKD
jgi:hypothetical protein